MKKSIMLVISILCLQQVFAQIWFTKTGAVSFYSHTNVEDIKAENNEVVSFIDAAKKEFRFQVLIKGFKFPKASMQEHFNGPDYMESDKFPKAEFKGMINAASAIDFKKDGTYKVEVEGQMTMHGVTKTLKVPGTITVKSGIPAVNAVFFVKRTEFGIEVPSFTAAKIADAIEVTVKCQYEAYKG
jgi:polyisoprenoid-binding protein YceI